jgi:hypothetical protein
MQAYFDSRSGALVACIEELTEGDTLALPNLGILGRDALRKAVLLALTLRGIRLRVRSVEPELQSELASWRREYRQASIERARRRGAYHHGRGGRPRVVDRDPIRSLLAKGLTPIEVSRRLSIATTTAYRIAHELRREKAAR